MKYFIINLIIILFYSALNGQADFDLFKEQALNDTIEFKLDIDFDLANYKKIIHIDKFPDKDQLIDKEYFINKKEAASKDYYANCKIKLTEELTAFIITYYSTMDTSKNYPYSGAEFKHILYLYNTKKHTNTDTKIKIKPIIVSERSFWLEPINSGDKINEYWIESKLYKQEDQMILEKKIRNIVAHPDFTKMYDHIKPKVTEVQHFRLEDGQFVPLP